MKLHCWPVLAVFLAAALSARAELQWRGVTITEGKPLFSLHSTEDQTSKWVSLGQSFAGSRVLSYDPLTEVLGIETEGAKKTLRLKSTVIGTATPTADAGLQGLRGIELAYELARRGDSEVATALQPYQAILTRLEEVKNAAQLGSPSNADAAAATTAAMRFLVNSSEELRSQLEKLAETKVAKLLPAPAKP